MIALQNIRPVIVLVSLWISLTSVLAEGAERPMPDGGGPTEVQCFVGVLDVDEVNGAKQSFIANVFIVVRWTDPREAHSASGSIMKNADEIWRPKVIFLNRQKITASLGDYVEITPEGEVSYRQRVWGNFSQPLKLKDFPFDTQDFELKIVYAGSGGEEEIKLVPLLETESFIIDEISAADWNVIGHRIKSDPLVLPTGDRVPAFSFVFTAERLSMFYVIRLVAPLMMIVLLFGKVLRELRLKSLLPIIAHLVLRTKKRAPLSRTSRMELVE